MFSCFCMIRSFRKKKTANWIEDYIWKVKRWLKSEPSQRDFKGFTFWCLFTFERINPELSFYFVKILKPLRKEDFFPVSGTEEYCVTQIKLHIHSFDLSSMVWKLLHVLPYDHFAQLLQSWRSNRAWRTNPVIAIHDNICLWIQTLVLTFRIV